MKLVGLFGAAWGSIGVIAILVVAIYRLTPIAWTAYAGDLSSAQWVFAVVFLLVMAYSEGYRGFQLRFSPRTAARIRYLRDHPRLMHALFAPIFSMGFFCANRRTRITAFALSTVIVGLVLIVQRFDQPWRGIIDGGVVLGLSWGTVSLIACVAAALTRDDYPHSPEVPNPA